MHSFMRQSGWLACLIGSCTLASYAQSAPGLTPRRAPQDYAAFARGTDCIYAASVVPADQVKHLFAVDISKLYVVFEVAVYPADKAKITIGTDDLIVKSGKNTEFVHDADAMTVASVIQQKNAPPPPSVGRDVAVYPTASVGYESGTDPYSGRRVHGTYTEVGVGVAAGPGVNDPHYPPPPRIDPQQIQILEDQLSQKALPQGSITTAVAGYLYFPASRTKKSSSDSYELDYLGERSAEIHLNVPEKPRH